MKKIKLFDYQQEMLEKIITKLTKNSFTPFRKRKEYVENYSVLVQMPTGTGKTYVMASVVKWFLYFLFFLNVIKEKEKISFFESSISLCCSLSMISQFSELIEGKYVSAFGIFLSTIVRYRLSARFKHCL